jgi:uncharacterized membrane protein
MVCIIGTPICILASTLFDMIIFTMYESKDLPMFIKYIYAVNETLFPAISLFLIVISLYGISKNIKNQSNKAISADAKSRAAE